MKLYNANLSPNCLRVRAVVFELELDVEIVEVDVFKGAAKKPEFLEMNRNAKVPVLVDGDFVIWESRAIAGYLASKRPERGLMPRDARGRATVDQWSYWQAIHLGPAMQKVAFERVIKQKFGMGEPNEAVVEAQLKDARRYLSVLDQGLGDRDWIAGDLSVADFALASTFMYREPAGIGLEDVGRVGPWIERMEARPSWQRAVQALTGA